MSARLINMNDLRNLRYTILKGMRRIGQGSYASVYESVKKHGVVTKVTTDKLGYQFMADQLWQDVRSHAEQNFPKLTQDHGEVGASSGRDAYAVEVEHLIKVKNPLHRKYVKQLIADWKSFRDLEENFGARYAQFCRDRSIAFCELKIEQKAPYPEVFESMIYFFSNYGGHWDLKMENFMERESTGDLIFNDVVMDGDDYHRRSYADRHYA